MKNKVVRLICLVVFVGFLSSCTEEAIAPEGPRDPASGQATGKP